MGSIRPYPSLSVAYTSRWMICFKLFNAAGLWISLLRSQVRFYAIVQRIRLHAHSRRPRLSASLRSANGEQR